MKLINLGAAALLGAGTLLGGSSAFAANADIVGLWTGGAIWGNVNRDRLDDKGTLNPATGKLDLNPGNYGVGNSGSARSNYSGRYAANPNLAFAISEQDPGLNSRMSENYPMYKPEYWPLVQLSGYLTFSDPTGQFLDPVWKNLPLGMPQLGAPSAIVQGPNPDELFFIYGNRNQWRYIPTDCRKFDDSLVYASVSYNGISVGCWEGNTLVVTSKGYTDQSLLKNFVGGVHSNEMEIEERLVLNAEKTQIAYTRIVKDPMFLQPWNMGTNNLNRNTNKNAFVPEDLPFDNRHLLEVGGGG
jgi:hypothetical protein